MSTTPLSAAHAAASDVTSLPPMTVAPAPAEARPTDPDRCVVFALHADADPGTLPRVLELFAKRGLVPLAMSSRLTGDRLLVEVEVAGMVRAESDHVANCLRQLPMVERATATERAPLTDRAAAD